jgi:hypothetical protein
MVEYDFGEVDEIAPAYAITIHKSQGSKFPAVVIPVATRHSMLLQRSLIYTGITRGKKLVVLIGKRKALSIAVHDDRPQMVYPDLLGQPAVPMSDTLRLLPRSRIPLPSAIVRLRQLPRAIGSPHASKSSDRWGNRIPCDDLELDRGRKTAPIECFSQIRAKPSRHHVSQGVRWHVFAAVTGLRGRSTPQAGRLG